MNNQDERQLKIYELANLLEMAGSLEPLCPEEIAARDTFLQTGGFDGDPERAAILARRAQALMPDWLNKLKDAPTDKVVLFRPRN